MGCGTQHRDGCDAGSDLAPWSDVPGWPEWNGDIERIALAGPFAAGSRITMTPPGQEPFVRTTHLAERLDEGRTRVTYRMEITGPAADSLVPEIGPQISAIFRSFWQRSSIAPGLQNSVSRTAASAGVAAVASRSVSFVRVSAVDE